MQILAKENENTNSNDTFTPMFIVALFTIAKIWKQPKCQSTDEWIKRMWYTHTRTHDGLLPNVIKNEMLPFATTWMDLEDIILSELGRTKTNTVWYHSYVESKR